MQQYNWIKDQKRTVTFNVLMGCLLFTHKIAGRHCRWLRRHHADSGCFRSGGGRRWSLVPHADVVDLPLPCGAEKRSGRSTLSQSSGSQSCQGCWLQQFKQQLVNSGQLGTAATLSDAATLQDNKQLQCDRRESRIIQRQTSSPGQTLSALDISPSGLWYSSSILFSWYFSVQQFPLYLHFSTLPVLFSSSSWEPTFIPAARCLFGEFLRWNSFLKKKPLVKSLLDRDWRPSRYRVITLKTHFQ